MHHGITYMYINFQQNRVCRSVKTVHTNLFAQYISQVLATTNSNFFKKLITSDKCFRKTYMFCIGEFIVYCPYIHFQQNLQLHAHSNFERINLFGHASS